MAHRCARTRFSLTRAGRSGRLPRIRKTKEKKEKENDMAETTKYVYFFGAGKKRHGRNDQIRLLLRRRKDRRQRRHAQPPRRQGRQPRGDGLPRPPGPAGLHDHDRGLHALLRRRQADRPGHPGSDRRLRRPARGVRRQEVRRRQEPAPRLRPLRRPRLDAGHDGHDPQPRPQRDRGPVARRAVRQPALGVGLLPPLHPDVLRRRDGGRQEVLREAHRPRPSTGRRSARTSRPTRRSSSPRRSRRSSARGTTRAPTSTAATTTSPTAGAPR